MSREHLWIRVPGCGGQKSGVGKTPDMFWKGMRGSRHCRYAQSSHHFSSCSVFPGVKHDQSIRKIKDKGFGKNQVVKKENKK